MGEAIIDLRALAMTKGTAKQTFTLRSRANKQDKVSGTVAIEYTYYTDEWEQKVASKLAEDMTKQPSAESGAPALVIDAKTVENVIDFITKNGGEEIKDPEQLISLLEGAKVLHVITHSSLFGSLEMTSSDDAVARKLEKGFETVRNKVIFRLFDRDSSGTISAREIALGIAMHSAATRREKAALYFDLFDKNHDSKLSKAEMSYLLQVIVDMWITGFSIKTDAAFSDSILDGLVRARGRENIQKKAEDLKKQHFELSLVSGVRGTGSAAI